VFLMLMTGFTVFVIAYAYSKIIEHFPYGGGGYVVARSCSAITRASSPAARCSSTTS